MFCIKSVPVGTLRSDGCHRPVRGMGCSLLLLAAHCTLARRAVGKSKQPYCFEMMQREPFAFAGLWDSWRMPGQNAAASMVMFAARIDLGPRSIIGRFTQRKEAML
jgi:hypothetical protein